MTQQDPGSIWGAVRAWADAAGLFLPPEDPAAARPKVPQSVCDNCPICQGAATLDQVNPQAVIELAEMARSILAGMGSALASAAEQRLASATAGHGDVVDAEDADTTEDSGHLDEQELGE